MHRIIQKITSLAVLLNESAPGDIKATATSSLWTFPSIVFSAIVIAWGAEAAQFVVSQGLALTVLAVIQTLPEFAVEGVIAYHAGKNPTVENIGLMTANFTGAIRLLLGLGWPMIFFISYAFNRKKHIKGGTYNIELKREHSVELVGLLIPALYVVFIAVKGSLHIGDSIILVALYLAYISLLLKLPPESKEKASEAEPIPRYILSHGPKLRVTLILACFLVGGTAIMLLADPFLKSMLALSAVLGVSPFIFVQWVAPFLSEFPEKTSAFYWARTVTKSPMALLNMISSAIAEATLLIAMIPVVFNITVGGFRVIDFDTSHRVEILLTAVQALLAFIFVSDLRFNWYQAGGLFGLWFAQFILPSIREEIIVVYVVWILVEIVVMALGKRHFQAFSAFAEVWREQIRGRARE